MNSVVFDSNVFISSFVFGGKPARLWTAVLDGDVRLVSSPTILAEVARVLREKFAMSNAQVEELVLQVARLADIVQPTERLSVVSDEPDNRVLECAVEGGADAIVTGDAHLLDVGTYEGIDIITVAEALTRLDVGGDEE